MLKKLGLIPALLSATAFAQDLYDIDHITVIEIEFSASNWDALMDANDLTDDGTKLPAKVTIDGDSFDSAGVAYKGNSSYDASYAKNPLNIELNYMYDQSYQGYTTLKLSSGKKDPSFVREVLCYEMGRKYMDMPLSNYAKVYINGTYYGLFCSSESIDGRYAERRVYGNKDNPRFKCNPPNGMGPGNEPSLDYLGADSALYANIYELKSPFGWAQLIDFMYQLEYNSANIETYLDLDRTLWMLAFNNVTANMDSYSGPTKQNYYMIQDDNGRWCPIIWDQNEGIGGFENVGGPPGPPDLADLTDLDMYLRSADATYPLIAKLLAVPRYKKMYVAHMRTIVAENITNDWYHTRAQELQDVIATEVQAEPNGWYSYADFVNNVDNTISGMDGAFGIAEVLDGREAYLTAQADWNLAAPVISTHTYAPAVVPANTMVTFTTSVTNATYVCLGYRTFTGNVFQKMQMFDDGAHGDGAAADGTYGVYVFAGAEDLQYYIYAENADAGIFSPVRAEHEFYSLVINSTVVINEVMPKNSGIVDDEEGKSEDWIELYNNSSSAVNLDGYFLSDDLADPNKWEFPNVSIPANGYLIIWCDEDTLDAGLHANFKLASSGETVILSNAMGFPVNQVTVPEVEGSTTYGRYPNGTGSCIRMVPTYNASNSFTALEIAEETTAVEFSIYPNPSSEWVTVLTNSDVPVDYQLYDLNGRLIFSGQVSTNTTLDIRSLQNGTYLIYLPATQSVRKLVKN